MGSTNIDDHWSASMVLQYLQRYPGGQTERGQTAGQFQPNLYTGEGYMFTGVISESWMRFSICGLIINDLDRCVDFDILVYTNNIS